MKTQQRRAEDRGAIARFISGICRGVAGFLDFIDKRQIIRRAAFLWVLWLTGEVAFWTMKFAWESSRPGMEVAAIIGAVWLPLGALQGAIFKFYDDKRDKQEDAKDGA